MKYFVEINDRDQTTRKLIRHLKKMAEQHESINLLTETKLKAKEDIAMAKLIDEGRKSGRADKKRILKRFGIKP